MADCTCSELTGSFPLSAEASQAAARTLNDLIAQSDTYPQVTVEAGRALPYPGATFAPADFTLTADQVDQPKAEYEVPLMRPAVKAWRVSSGGWLFLDHVYGLNDVVTYLVGVGDDGAVHGIEILVCDQDFWGISKPEWRAQFVGKAAGRWDPTTTVSAISGASSSSTHVAEGVKKILAIHARFLPR